MKKISVLLTSLFHLGRSKTATNTYAITFGNGLSMIFGFLFIITLNRLFSLSDFGYFSALYVLLLLVSDVADMGIGTSLSRFLPPLFHDQKKSDSFLKTSFLVQLIIAILLSGSMAFLSAFLGSILFKSQLFNTLFLVTSVGIFFAITANFILYALSAKQRFVSAAIYNALGGAIRLIVLLPVLVGHNVTVSSAIWVQTISLIILTVIGFFFIRVSFLYSTCTYKDLIDLLRFTFYVGLARSITAIAGKIDVLLLVSLTTPTEAGIYSTASRVIGIFPLFSGSFSTVIAPKFAAVKNRTTLHFLLRKVLLGTVLLVGSVVILIIFAQPFMQLLFGQKGLISTSVFQVLLISMIFFVGSVPAVSLAVYYLHKPHILTINSILQVIIVLVGNLFFIPKFGRFGPAYSLILAYGISLALTTYMSFWYLHKKND